MTDYRAPLADMRFALDEIAGLAEIARLPGHEAVEPELVDAVLAEAGRLATEVLAPLNQTGDREGCVLENGVVRSPAGFGAAYRELADGGWIGLAADPDHGGQGLPWALALAVQETWHAANMSLGLCPLLTQGAIELLRAHGTAAQKDVYLPKLVAGAWSGTMNLTEPQAGSDLGAVKTRAARDGAAYRIAGQKIFITYGEHELAENIVHMVLARSPDGPPGSKGLSLYLVPKYLPDANGAPGPRNDLRCVSLERKLGIHASPTAVMSYGDDGGATGFLVGEENGGLAAMFTMMNSARLMVGVQGLGVAEGAYQAALACARARVQGRPLGSRDGGSVPILRHPDVRRALLTMKARGEAMRALVYYTAGVMDRARRAPDPAERAARQSRLDLLTPVVKAWCSEGGCEVASLGLQVHGGMGYIEETGAAQFYRDARIAPIYEGTNGIQALDLVTRKLARDRGAAANALSAEMTAGAEALQGTGDSELKAIGGAVGEARYVLDTATGWMVETLEADIRKAAAGASPYARLFGTAAGGWLLGRAALAAHRRLKEGSAGSRGDSRADSGDDSRFLSAKIRTARFYADNLLPAVAGEAMAVMTGAESTLALEDDQF